MYATAMVKNGTERCRTPAHARQRRRPRSKKWLSGPFALLFLQWLPGCTVSVKSIRRNGTAPLAGMDAGKSGPLLPLRERRQHTGGCHADFRPPDHQALVAHLAHGDRGRDYRPHHRPLGARRRAAARPRRLAGLLARRTGACDLRGAALAVVMAAPNPDHVRTLDFRASADGQAADTNAPWAMVGGRPRYPPRRPRSRTPPAMIFVPILSPRRRPPNC